MRRVNHDEDVPLWRLVLRSGTERGERSGGICEIPVAASVEAP
jgi:hypothetical protein